MPQKKQTIEEQNRQMLEDEAASDFIVTRKGGDNLVNDADKEDEAIFDKLYGKIDKEKI